MKFYLFIGLILSGFVAISQTPGDNRRDMNAYYEKGDYVNATLNAIEFLRTNGTNKNAQEILSVSFNMAIEDINIEIKALMASSKTFSGDKTVNDRKTIITKYELLLKLDRQGREIVRIIPKQKVPLEFDKVEITSEFDAAQKSYDESLGLAAEMHYNNALDLTSKNNRASYKDAAKEFKRAEEFIKPYKDCGIKFEFYRKLGTTKVAIFPFEYLDQGYGSASSIGEEVSDNLKATFTRNKEDLAFVEIYTRDQLDGLVQEHNLNNTGIMDKQSVIKYGKATGVHLIITGKIYYVEQLEPNTSSTDFQTEKSVKVGEKKVINSKGVERTEGVYENVTAYNIKYYKSSIVNIKAYYEVTDIETGQTLNSDQFIETEKDECTWETFRNGDERAFKTNKTERPLISSLELKNKVTQKICNKIAQAVTSFLK